MEKFADEIDHHQDNSNAQTTAGQNAQNGQTALGGVEDRQHGSNHGHKPSADGGEDGHNRFDDAGVSGTSHNCNGIEIHENTTFQKILLCTVWPQPEHLHK